MNTRISIERLAIAMAEGMGKLPGGKAAVIVNVLGRPISCDAYQRAVAILRGPATRLARAPARGPHRRRWIASTGNTGRFIAGSEHGCSPVSQVDP
jgi:hypothetical protein